MNLRTLEKIKLNFKKIKMANKHVTCSISLVIRENAINAIIGFHFTCIRLSNLILIACCVVEDTEIKTANGRYVDRGHFGKQRGNSR